jgi:PadR family transcriptional regulator PadR
MDNVGSDLIRGNIETIVLRCLHISDMYGLEICNLIKEASGGTYILKQPTLYSALTRLERRGMISSYWRDSAIGGRRHYYRMTDQGKLGFSDKKDNWQDARGVIDTLVEDKKRAQDAQVNVPSAPQKPEPAPEPTKPPSAATRTQSFAANHAATPEDYIELMPYARRDKTPEPTPELTAKRHSFFEIDEIDTSPDVTTSPTTRFTPISPYNPYQSSDEYLTLPVSLETASKRLKTKEKQAEETPPLLRPFMLNADAEPGPKTTFTQNPRNDNRFDKYLSTDDYSALVKTKADTPDSAATAHKNANTDPAGMIQIRPFTKHFGAEHCGNLLLINKLKLFASFIVTCLVLTGLVLAQAYIAPAYTDGERIAFILAYSFIGTYFLYSIARYLVGPRVRRALTIRPVKFVARVALTVGVALAALSICVLTGFTFENTAEFMVYFTVPAVVAAGAIIEVLALAALKRMKFFKY